MRFGGHGVCEGRRVESSKADDGAMASDVRESGVRGAELAREGDVHDDQCVIKTVRWGRAG